MLIINMLEIDRLHEITFDNFKNAVDNTISNKIFVRNCINQNMPNLKTSEILSAINTVLLSPSTHSLIKTINNIEWTPIKLYQTAYYIVNLYNDFWLVSHNSHNGFVVRYTMKYHQYMNILFNTLNILNIPHLEQMYWCSQNELHLASNIMEQDNKQILLIKQTTFINNQLKINHYLYKNGNQIYYFPICNIGIYKPLLYKNI